jgi:hypothetical protein
MSEGRAEAVSADEGVGWSAIPKFGGSRSGSASWSDFSAA